MEFIDQPATIQGTNMTNAEALVAYREENEKLMAILAEYIERYGLTDQARAYFLKPAVPPSP